MTFPIKCMQMLPVNVVIQTDQGDVSPVQVSAEILKTLSQRGQEL